MLGQKMQVNLICFYSLSAIVPLYAFRKKKLLTCNYYKGSVFAGHQLKEKEGRKKSECLHKEKGVLEISTVCEKQTFSETLFCIQFFFSLRRASKKLPQCLYASDQEINLYIFL